MNTAARTEQETTALQMCILVSADAPRAAPAWRSMRTRNLRDRHQPIMMFPLVRTPAEAAECVALTNYPPQGRRGWGPFLAHSRWGVELLDYLPRRGAETVCCLLIETKDAIHNLEEICKVVGIDYMIIATFDLSTELGVSGKFDALILLEAVRHAERVILEAGIALGAAAFTKEQAQTNLNRGRRLMVYGFDVLPLKQHARQAMEWSRPEAREALTRDDEVALVTGCPSRRLSDIFDLSRRRSISLLVHNAS